MHAKSIQAAAVEVDFAQEPILQSELRQTQYYCYEIALISQTPEGLLNKIFLP